ncbi:MAG: hypothetical protein ATN31_08665 [Candidatus Epulonipiscioides saccharophilum]|nr:MAG: hypothetical protein ATN31_08665 [Epulopiscium sp. AS2M-Bin001]
MSKHRFIVVNLKEWKVPAVMLGISILCFVSYLEIIDSKATHATSVEVFSPTHTYDDGIYKANLAFKDANINLVVTIEDETIVSVNLEDFDERERMLYPTLNNSIKFVNDYVQRTQSIEITDKTINLSPATSILMDAINIALSKTPEAKLSTNYQSPLLEEISTQPQD